MSLALLHRRLAILMGAAALLAFAAGAGLHPWLWAAYGGLAVALVWQPPLAAAGWVERIGWLGAAGLFTWVLQVAIVAGGDFLRPVLALLLFLLVAEALRPLETYNDLRLYALSFALLVAATAYFPGVLFALAFVLYLALATLALMVGYLRRTAAYFHADAGALRPSYLVATAALSTVTVLLSALVFAAFPRLPWSGVGIARAAGHTAMVGFGEGVSLGEHGGRIHSNPEIALRVEFDAPPASLETLRWRGRSYDHFDGVRWSRSRGIPVSAPPPHLYGERWGDGAQARYRIFGGPPGVRVLFGLHPVVDVVPRTPMRPWLDPSGDIVYAGGDAPIYQVTSVTAFPEESALRGAEGAEPAGVTHYLQLPPLPGRIWQLADSLTRGQPTRYEAARAVERWLQTEFGYTLELPATARETSIDHFLFERRQGHCEYFSTAMVVMLRMVGIPARNVTGFLGGEWQASAGYLAVTQNDAHSWVEVWFPGLGWVPFDPTPAADRNRLAGSASNPAWTWPLRFWADGVQHRWTKWVLHYDSDAQQAMFRRVAALVARSDAAAPAGRGEAIRPPLSWLLGMLLIAGIGWRVRSGRARGGRVPAETRLYLALRDAYRRAGYPTHRTPTPATLLEVLEAAHAPGLAEAREVVALYQRARFGGEPLEAAGRARMAAGVAAVRRALRAARRAPAAGAATP